MPRGDRSIFRPPTTLRNWRSGLSNPLGFSQGQGWRGQEALRMAPLVRRSDWQFEAI